MQVSLNTVHLRPGDLFTCSSSGKVEKKIGLDCTRVSCPLVVYPPGTLLHLPTARTLQPDCWQMYAGWGGNPHHAEESGLFFQLSFYPIQRTLKDLFDTVFVVAQLKRIIVCV